MILDPDAAADVKLARVERMIEAFSDWTDRRSPDGAAVAIMDGGTLAGSAGHGVYSAEQPVPVASLSKAITAVGVALLVDEGRLTLDDSIGALLPDYLADHSPADARAKEITVAQLVTHSSGLIHDPSQGSRFLKFQPYTAPSMSPQLQAALARKLGEKVYAYNNANYVALAMIIEVVTGSEYEEFCRERVLRPAGVTRARLNPLLLARGPYGGWIISVEDYVRFLAYLNPHDPLVPLPLARWPRVDSSEGVSYALGVFLRNVGEGYVAFHSGGFHGMPGIDLSYEAYQAQWYRNYGYVVAYTPSASAEVFRDLTSSMAQAARGEDQRRR